MNRMVTSPCCGWRASKESRAPRQPFTQVTNWKRGRRSRRKRLQIQNRAHQTLDLPASKGQPVRGEGARRRCGITTELRHLGLSRPLVHTSYIKYYICSRGGRSLPRWLNVSLALSLSLLPRCIFRHFSLLSLPIPFWARVLVLPPTRPILFRPFALRLTNLLSPTTQLSLSNLPPPFFLLLLSRLFSSPLFSLLSSSLSLSLPLSLQSRLP
jgi:hypothetical protein